MPIRRKPALDELERRIGYAFKDKALAQEALTHASAGAEHRRRDNERLEFLGDRVLGLVIAAMVFERFHDAREAELARSYNSLVNTERCAEAAQMLDLGSHLVLAAGEAHSGGRNKPVILADACEALLGAVYLDGGFDAAEAVIRALWSPFVQLSEPAGRDPKTALQEYAQGLKQGLPEYREISRSGPPHGPVFTVEVCVKGLEPARGEGPSLKKAQQSAAEALLVREAIWPGEQRSASV